MKNSIWGIILMVIGIVCILVGIAGVITALSETNKRTSELSEFTSNSNTVKEFHYEVIRKFGYYEMLYVTILGTALCGLGCLVNHSYNSYFERKRIREIMENGCRENTDSVTPQEIEIRKVMKTRKNQ